MSATSFLSNEGPWQTLAARIKAARHVDAAIAYFGQGGAKLLPLGKGDRLVVDMSSPTVRAGGTDPREIEKLIRRRVDVFTRRNLHAKVVVADRCVITGSANVSKHSQEVLDEAAILTEEQAAKYSFDLKAILAAAKRRQRRSRHKVVSFAPKKGLSA